MSKPITFSALLIEQGRVIKEASFVARPEEAFTVAHDGIDVIKGHWVSLSPVTESNDHPSTMLPAAPSEIEEK